MRQRDTRPSPAARRPLETRFCRNCQAESSPGLRRCGNCAASLEGSGQDAHDTRIRAERDARVKDALQAEARAAQVEEASRRAQTSAEQEAAALAEESGRRGAQVRARLAIAVVALCLVAVSTATLHLILAPTVHVIRWGALVGLLVCVSATLAIFLRVKGSIDRF
jgi:Flp pilus assembly protein TadB